MPGSNRRPWAHKTHALEPTELMECMYGIVIPVLLMTLGLQNGGDYIRVYGRIRLNKLL